MSQGLPEIHLVPKYENIDHRRGNQEEQTCVDGTHSAVRNEEIRFDTICTENPGAALA